MKTSLSALISARTSSGLSLACSLLALGASLPQHALAEGIEEVIVTATKRAESVQEVPVAVSAMTGEEMQNRGIFSTGDLMGNVPNLQVNSPWGETQPNFNLRGVGVANEFNANVASPIGVYFDEVYEGFRAAQGAQIYDIERIEVVKGPQGTLYGRNTTGGAINIISRTPEMGENNGYVTVGYGNYNRKRVQAAAETTLVEGLLGVRAAGTWIKGDGYIENKNADYGVNNTLVGNDDFASEDSRSARLTFRATPADELDIILKLYTGESKPIGAAPIPVFVESAAPLPAQGFGRDPALGDDEAVSFRGGRFYNDADGAMLKVTWDMNDAVTLVSTTAIADNKQNLSIDFGGSTFAAAGLPADIDVADIGYSNYIAENEAFNQDFRLNFSGDDYNLIVGLYYGDDTIETDNRVTFSGYLDSTVPTGSFNPLGLFGPALGPATSFDALQEFTQERTSKAFYTEFAYDVTTQFSVTVGARYTEDDNSLDDFMALYLNTADEGTAYAYYSDPNPAPTIFPVNPAAYLPKITSSESNWTGRIIVDYTINDDVMTYASYSKGYRAGAFNGLAIAGPEQIYLTEPEELDAYEIGVKSQFLDNSLQINAAAFFYDYTNQQLQESVGAATFLRNLNSEVYGLEIESIYYATTDLKFNVDIGMLDTEYEKDQLLSGIDIGGNEQPFAPDITANIGVDYTLAHIADGELRLHADVQYKGHQWFDPFNAEQAEGPIKDGEDSYWLSNARLSYTTDKITTAVYIKNITDKYYNAYAINTEGFASNNYFIRGEPRTFGVELTYNFF